MVVVAPGAAAPSDGPSGGGSLESLFEGPGEAGERAGSTGRASDDFFKGLLTTALGADEILTEVRVPVCGPKVGCAYLKFPHPASRFAVVGVAAVLTIDGGKVTKAGVGITGAGSKAVRARGAALSGKTLDAATIQAAADKAPDGVDVQADLQGSEEYKRHLLKVFARRSIEAAAAAVK